MLDKIKTNKFSLGRITKDWFIPLGIAIALATTVKGYALTRVDVDGPSMASTLKNKDVMFEEKISKLTNDIKRGDIITFNSHDILRPSYIKRVIGLAGDCIELKEGKVYLNNEELSEPYLSAGTYTGEEEFLKENIKFTIPKDTLFVMGDNREVSEDSRCFGPVKYKDIQGRVFLRVYPWNTVKTF